MIPIKYRLDSAAEEEYIQKSLSCMDNVRYYSDKLEELLRDMNQNGLSVAGKILNRAKRFVKAHSDSWCLCEWLVISYDEMTEIRNYLYDLIDSDLKTVNKEIKNTGHRVVEIRSYHDLRSRRKKEYAGDTGKEVKKILLAPIDYDDVYNAFKEFNVFYDKWSKERINYWITEKTELKVCPYCNISYTYNRGEAVTAQLDHFYPKSEYPVLALCFYNLVPCCPACNRIKLDDTVKMVSPYQDGAFKDLRITWSYRKDAGQDKCGTNGSLTTLEEMIEIKIETPEEDERHNLDSMKIEEAYEQHRDYAGEIIKKAMIYTNPEAQKLICAIGASAEITPEEIERFYLGNYLDENDLKKRPLSKMTKDFYQEIIRAKNRPSP